MVNISFQPYAEHHDEKTVRWLNDPQIKESFGLTDMLTVESHRKWIESQRHYYLWAIYDEEGVHRGNVGLFHNPKHHSAYFQLYIGDAKARGKGLGKAALSFAMDYAFNELHVNRFYLHVFPENIPAIRLYEKMGLQREGIEREAHFFNGKYRDQCIYSILYREWRAKKGGS